jgi:hypothetical protein
VIWKKWEKNKEDLDLRIQNLATSNAALGVELYTATRQLDTTKTAFLDHLKEDHETENRQIETLETANRRIETLETNQEFLSVVAELFVAVLFVVWSHLLYTARNGTVSCTANYWLGYCVWNVTFGFGLYWADSFVHFMLIYVTIELCVMGTRIFVDPPMLRANSFAIKHSKTAAKLQGTAIDVAKTRIAKVYEQNQAIGFVLCIIVISSFLVILLIRYGVSWLEFYLFKSRTYSIALTDLQGCLHFLCVLIQCQIRIVPCFISCPCLEQDDEREGKWMKWMITKEGCILFRIYSVAVYFFSRMSGQGFIDPLKNDAHVFIFACFSDQIIAYVDACLSWTSI